MTRFFALLSCLLLITCLCLGVSAADTTRATSINVMATVSSNGSCEVNCAITLHVADPQAKLAYPVPLSASSITLNGKPVLTEKTDTARLISLNRLLGGMVGDFSFSVGYSVNNAVTILSTPTEATTEATTEETTAATTAPEGETLPTMPTAPTAPAQPERRLLLEIPMLAGFAYPIDLLQFSISLPGNVTETPNFFSGYHRENIEKDLSYTISGGSIAGRNTNVLKDQETLSMFLNVTEAMFPQSQMDLPKLDDVIPLVGIVAGVAFLFWLLFLRNYLPIREFPAVAPEGFGAGQMGTLLTMEGANLNLMIFSWAQLGYVSLRLDRRGHVFVQKRMDMGNERTAFEQKCFHHLFSRRDLVDTASTGYQRIVQNVQNQKPAQQMFRTKRLVYGKIFRVISAAAGLLCGACFGIVLGNLLGYGWVFMIIQALVGLVCSWHIQFWPQGVFLHYRPQLWISLALTGLWLALGLSVQQFPLALLAVGIQLLAGLLATFGGRRTEEGRNAMGQILSLRRYLRKLSEKQIRQLSQNNPEAFFDMAPFAIALGCDGALARHFGKGRLPVCPYIEAADTHGLTATQWDQLMRQVLGGMTARQKRSFMDGIHSVLKNYMR